MAEANCGASVQAVAIRVAVLELDGVPLPGANNVYTTDALTQLTATPVYTKGTDIEKMNAGGTLCVNYRTRDVLRRYDLGLEVCTLDPELEEMLVGGLLFSSAGTHIGASSPKVGAIEAANGVSVELWTKHIVGGDVDSVWPYVHWVIPRSYWQLGPTVFNDDAMPRPFVGWTTENPNWFNGPANDWAYDSSRSIAWAFTKSLPVVTCGSQTLTGT